MKVFGMAGWSGSGKTTLVEKLIPQFTARGLRVSVIKHAHHGFDLDRPGKDSWRHREAGATQVLMLSNDRWVLMHELRGAPEPSLDEQLRLLQPCALENPHVVAVASDVEIACPLPLLPLNDPAAVAAFILDHLDAQ